MTWCAVGMISALIDLFLRFLRVTHLVVSFFMEFKTSCQKKHYNRRRPDAFTLNAREGKGSLAEKKEGRPMAEGEEGTVASLSSWKLLFLVGRLTGVCQLLTSMQNLCSKLVF